MKTMALLWNISSALATRFNCSEFTVTIRRIFYFILRPDFLMTRRPLNDELHLKSSRRWTSLSATTFGLATATTETDRQV